MPFWAHSGRQEDRSDWELLADHLPEVAELAAYLADPLGLARTARLAGLFHDLGKFHPDFQARIGGASLSVDHSTAGGALLMQAAAQLGANERVVAEVIAYAVLGHHAGLPDMLKGGEAGLQYRIERFRDGLAPDWRAVAPPDFAGLPAELMAKVRLADEARRSFDLSLAARMVFSCLVDADFKATERFYAALDGVQPDRDWPALQPHLADHIAALDRHLAAFSQEGEVNAIRRRVMAHVRAQAAQAPGPFTLTVPTGGGKTLASLAFALEHARIHGKRRVIYVIPYTSIIDQTAAEFRKVLGEGHILEHHAAIDEAELRDPDRNWSGRDKLRLAMEDWAAPIVVTTAVQFFESLFAARPSRARKLHNIAGSVVVLDEAQTLPRGLLAPCLRMLDGLTTHYGVSAVLCTATQPALDENLKMKRGNTQDEITLGLPLAGRELAPDPDALNREMRRTKIDHAGVMDDAALVAALGAHPQGLVVVNSRRHALELYRAAKGLDGAIHLTTRQHADDRSAIIRGIRQRLEAGLPCRVIATSLIEAGVDLSFRRAWRAEAGLDQIIQVAGRVNRHGEYPRDDSIVTVFQPADWPAPREIAGLAGDLRQIMATHDDLQSNAAIEAYFRQVYWRHGVGRDGLDAKDILSRLSLSFRTQILTDFAFRSIAEDFRMIEDGLAPVIIMDDPDALEGRLRGNESSGKIARLVQRRVVQIPPQARATMIAAGAVRFAAPEQRGEQFPLLVRPQLYSRETGLQWEDADVLTPRESVY